MNGLEFRSPDISSIVEEIVGQAGWVSGNAMVIYYDENGSDKGGVVGVDEWGWYCSLRNDAASSAPVYATLEVSYT